MNEIFSIIQNSVAWSILIIAASLVVVVWATRAVARMTWRTNCLVRWAFIGMAVCAFYIGTGPLFGHRPSLFEGLLMLSLSVFSLADRRGSAKREVLGLRGSEAGPGAHSGRI